MYVKTYIKICVSILIFLFIESCVAGKSQCVQNRYFVNSIDSLTLTYYYLINISPVDSINIKYNLLSKKINDSYTNSSIITVGGKYVFKIEPMYDIIEKKGDKDTVFYSPAFMKAVVINNILLFNENYSVKPYKTNMLVGLRLYLHNKRYNDEREQVYAYQSSWTFKDLDKTVTLKVIYFDPQLNYSIDYYPNFLLGVTPQNDTMAIIDKRFYGKVKVKSEVIIKPSVWTQTDKDAFSMKGYPNLLRLTRNIKTVYYGELSVK